MSAWPHSPTCNEATCRGHVKPASTVDRNSTYENAVEAIGLQVGSLAELNIRRFLAALPPSIVVDGRVVELAAINHGFDAERCPWFYDGCNCPGAIAELIEAAREVAGRES